MENEITKAYVAKEISQYETELEQGAEIRRLLLVDFEDQLANFYKLSEEITINEGGDAEDTLAIISMPGGENFQIINNSALASNGELQPSFIMSRLKVRDGNEESLLSKIICIDKENGYLYSASYPHKNDVTGDFHYETPTLQVVTDAEKIAGYVSLLEKAHLVHEKLATKLHRKHLKIMEKTAQF